MLFREGLIKRKYKILWHVKLIIIFFFCGFGQSNLSAEKDFLSGSLIAEEKAGHFFGMSLEELMDIHVKVDVASLFLEDEFVVGSSVSKITPEDWKRTGARRMHEAFSNVMSMMTYPTQGGAPAVSIRGYTSATSVRGVAFILDGVHLDSLSAGTAFYQIPNWELGTLNGIEIIKGPGSAIYGTEAFHGVISLKTFESQTDRYSIEAAGAYPLYGDASVNISHGLFDDLIRLDAAAGISKQDDLDMEYDYDAGTNAAGDYNAGTSKRKFEYNNVTGLLKLRINPAKKLKLKAGSYISKWKSEEFQGVGLTFNQTDDTTSGDTIFIMGNGSIAYTLDNDVSIEADGYFWQYDLSMDYPFAFSDSVLTQDIPEEKRYSANFTIKQPENAFGLQWVLAYSYSKWEVSSDSKLYVTQASTGGLFPHPATGEPFMNNALTWAGITRIINSVFGQTKWAAIRDTLFLLLGVRYDRYSDYGDQISPRGGIIFQPAKESVLKALYGRAFKAPTGSELYGSGGAPVVNPDIKAETIDTLELIYLYKIRNLKLNLNLFGSLWKNGIVVRDQQYVNKGENRSFGVEGELYYLYNQFAFDLGFSYVKSEELNIDIDNPGVKGNTDRDYAAFPKYSFRNGLYYTLKPYGILFYLNNRIYMKMKESGYDRMNNPDDLPVYWRMDLDINKSVNEKFDIHLNIRNLTNRKNYVPGIWGNENGIEEPGISTLLRVNYKL